METCLILFSFFFFFFFTRNKIFSNLYDIFLSFDIAIAFDVRFLQTCFLFTYVYIYLCFELNHTVWITLGEISILRFVVKLEIQKNIVFLLFLMKTYVYMYVYVYAYSKELLNCFNVVLVNELIKNSWIFINVLEFDINIG